MGGKVMSINIEKWKSGDLNKEVREKIERNFEALVKEMAIRFGYAFSEMNAGRTINNVYFFNNENDFIKWDANREGNSDLLIASLALPTGTTQQATLKVAMLQTPDSVIASGVSVPLEFVYKSYYGDDENDASGTPGTFAIKVNGTEIADLKTILVHGKTYSYELQEYMQSGDNTIYITITNNEGATRNYTYNVQVVSLELVFPSQSVTALQTVQTASFNLPVQLVGHSGNVEYYLDNELKETVGMEANSIHTFLVKVSTHGVHQVRFTATTAESGVSISAQPVQSEFIFSTGNNTPAIASDFKQVQATLYDTLKIGYWVFSQAESPVTINVSIQSADGVVLYKSAEQVALQNGASSRQEWNVPLLETSYVGERKLVLALGETVREFPIAIQAAEFTLAPASECFFHLSSAGRTNNSADRNSWKSVQNVNGVIHTYETVFSQYFAFAENGSGWNYDAKGDVACHVRAGDRISVNYCPFSTNFGQGDDVTNFGTKTGATFEIELATRTCVNPETVIAKCLDEEAGIGFIIYANRVVYRTSSVSVETQFNENEKVRIGFMTEVGNYTTGQPALFNTIWINGVPQVTTRYTRTETFRQANLQDIVIGSDECDVDVYSMRGYLKALSIKEMIANYSYDTPATADKLAIYKRNDIFDGSGQVNYLKLRAARPELPILFLQVDHLPESKANDDITVPLTTLENPASVAEDDAPSHTSENTKMGVQGTSSATVTAVDPFGGFFFFNYKLKYGKSLGIFLTVYNKKVKAFSLYVGGIASKTYCLKKNYRSSEMANNAVISMLWTDVLKYIQAYTPMQQAQLDETGVITYRNSIYSVPCVAFWDKPNAGRYFVGMFDFNNDKSNSEIFGLDREKYPDAEFWEISENTTNFLHKMEKPYWDATEGEVVNPVTAEFEARFPDGSANLDGSGKPLDYGNAINEAQVATAQVECETIRRFNNWNYECTRSLATNALLSEAYTDVDGRVWNTDTADYRTARFRTEQPQYFNLQFALAYNIWRKRLLMIDSMSKNLQLLFVNRIMYPEVYDADSGLGINNLGVMNMKFYYEDEDESEDLQIFNGAKNSFWNSLQAAYPKEMQAMDNRMRGTGTPFSFEALIKMFEDHQDAWCEALFAYQMWAQYKSAKGGELEAAYGDKKQQRRWWLYNSFRYWDSKYSSGEAVRNQFTLAFWGSGGDIVGVKPYMQSYIGVRWGNTSNNVQTYRCLNYEKGVTVKNGTATSDNKNYYVSFLSADLITDTGDLSALGSVKVSDFSPLTRVRKIQIGRDEEGYENNDQYTLDFSHNTFLEVLDISNLKRLGYNEASGTTGDFVLSLRNNTLLKYIHAKGSSLTGVELPDSDKLLGMWLGSNIKYLNLQDKPNLDTLYMESGEYIQTLYYKNCPKINIQSIVEDVLSYNNIALRNCSLEGINFVGFPIERMMRLASIGAKLTGKIELASSATDTLSAEQKQQLIAQYGNIDDEKNDLYVIYYIRSIGTVNVLGQNYFTSPGEYQLTAQILPGTGNNVSSIAWSIEENQYATINSKTGVLRVTKIATDSEPTAIVTCTVTKIGGSTVSGTLKVGFYQRAARLGDYVYADGSFSDVYDSTRTIVGICYYINPDDPDDRRCFCPVYSNEARNMVFGSGTIQSQNNTVDGVNSGLSINYNNFIDETNGKVKTFSNGALSFDNGKDMLKAYIEKRNNVLASKSWPIPYTMDELFVYLEAYDTGTNTWNKETKYFFPLCSYAYLYKPTIKDNEILAEIFKEGNWYIPALFELAIIQLYKELKNTEGYTYFRDAMNRGIISNIYSNNIASCITGSTNELARLVVQNSSVHIQCQFKNEQVWGERYITHLCCNF